MANQFNTGGARGRDGAYRRSAPSGGTRFKTSGSEGRLSSQPLAYRQAPPRRAASAPGQRGVQPAYYRTPLRPQKNSPIPIIIAGVVIAALIAAIIFFVVPAVGSLFSSSQEPSVEAGVEVEVTIPEGASGDQIASILAENHIIEDPKVYYATVREMQADMLLKPGDYLFTTLQDPSEVVQQLIDGPNIVGVTLTIQEGLTIDQTAARVEETYGIPADDFLELLNPDSLKVLKGCKVEPGLSAAKPGESFQFMRQGYFCVDKNSTPDHIVINRTVALNSSWGK